MGANIHIGETRGRATLRLSAELHPQSSMTLFVGDGRDMSVREISIIEGEAARLDAELARLAGLIRALEAGEAGGPRTRALAAAGAALAADVRQVAAERKWYSVSAVGLLEAAKAVGSAASPIVDSAVKVLDLLRKAAT